jgi:cobalt-precorrin-5B (C1)-methyltransferase
VAKLAHYIQVGQQRLRCGYTTGSCAAAAARGAAELLLTGTAPAVIELNTPAGIPIQADIEDAHMEGASAVCAVRKDAGDDPDVTDGLLIYATVTKIPDLPCLVDGGEGVGRVTRPGLDQPMGYAAINSTPRRMILEQLETVCQANGIAGGLEAVISIPQGRLLAEKTFNPRLGIEGGLSILGTSGIVRPMSETALIATIHAEMDMRRAEGVKDLLVSPGNYGAAFCRDCLGLALEESVQCSNYVGETLDYAALLGFRSMLLVGHIGKLVKCAAGVMNTHSRVADGRMETLAAHAAMSGADCALVTKVMEATTTDAALALLQEQNLLGATMESVLLRLKRHLQQRAGQNMQVEAILFSNQLGLLGMTVGAEELLALQKRSGSA